MKTYSIPAGRYYFGDPCYVIRESWADLLESTDYLEDCTNSDGVFAGSTAYGDGTYHGTCGSIFNINQFPVDAGVLGFVHESKIETDEAEELGVMVDIPENSTFTIDRGVFSLNGKEIVDTSPEDDYCDEEDDYCDEEDDYCDEEDDYCDEE